MDGLSKGWQFEVCILIEQVVKKSLDLWEINRSMVINCKREVQARYTERIIVSSKVFCGKQIIF
jgi:hypothetical protein